MKKKKVIHTVGKRKVAIARATAKSGKGEITINKRSLSLIQPESARLMINEPLVLGSDIAKKLDININVKGGGVFGQGGKVVLAGDPETQTYGINRSREGFKVLQKAFGQTDFVSYVQLNKIYRSEFVEFVDDLFKGV